MSETPERIWAYAGAFRMWREKYPEHVKSPTEYIRADHVDAMLKEEREKALREAAVICNQSYGGSIGDVHKAILALIEKNSTDG